MTLEDLMMVYDVAIMGRPRRAAEHRIGIRAVVTALRDESDNFVTAIGVRGMLDKILASDGEVQAAGASTRKDEGEHAGDGVDVFPSAIGSFPTPAAAPVCVWTQQKRLLAFYDTQCGLGSLTHENVRLKCQDFCPNCDRPISFKSEAAR
jgi:hypothetical protein